jgi:DedD protein
MPLPSLFKRKNKPPTEERSAVPPAADETGPVQEARIRARRRLIGAVVLLAVGIIGFPLIFETAPRPIPVDIPIEIPRKEGQSPLPTPQPALPPAVTTPPGSAVITESPSEAGTDVPPPAAPAALAAASAPASAPLRAAAAPAQRASAAAKVDDGQRARALLEGAPVAKLAPAAPSAPSTRASDAQAGRFVVQVGAYTDAAALRDARQKVEKLGMKTYTQVIETEAGKRTRVRVGPFATREEAAAAGQALKAAGLPANILAL